MRARAQDSVPPGITLRSCGPGDEERLAELCGELGYPSSTAAVTRRLKRLSDREDHLVLVAVDGSDRPIGWIHAFVGYRLESDPFAEIGGLVVGGAHRGAAAGERLLAAAEEWAEARGVATIRVRSNVVRERAHRFYERAGYLRSKTTHVFDKPLRAS